MGQNDVSQLQAEYEGLRDRLADIGREGDENAMEMRRLFSEAGAAWDNDDRAGAKALSERGHIAKTRSEAANAEARDLIQRLRATEVCLRQAEHEAARRNRPTEGSMVPSAYGTRLRGFEHTHGWSVSTVCKFLERLPRRPFVEIDAIEYLDIVDANHKAGETENLRDRSRKVGIKVYRPPVDLTGASLTVTKRKR